MNKNDAIRIRHMLDAAEEALSFAQGKSRDDLEHNRQFALAVIRDIEIIGEAAAKVSEETRKKFVEIPWLDIICMRNHLVHACFDTDLDVVWDTLQSDLPPLVQKLKQLQIKI